LKTLKQIVRVDKERYRILINFSKYSNNLYNYTLYIANQFYEETGDYIGFKKLYHEVKVNENYKLLPSQCANQIVKLVDQNFRSFFAKLKRKLNGQYSDKVQPPKYRKKGSLFNIIYTNQFAFIRNNRIDFTKSINYSKLNKDKLFIDFTYKIEGKMKQILLKPINEGQYFIMYINYEENRKYNSKLNKDKYLSIDLGINNLCTCIDISTGHSFIMNGKPLKSYNRWYNKKLAERRSEIKLKNNLNWCKSLAKLNLKRNNYVDNYFNQVVNKLIKYCLNKDIGNIILGYNESWKNGTNIGKINNQKFQYIPYLIFKNKLKNKNIVNVIFQEESYTSKCSFLDKEEIKHHENYLGKRIKRGLFKTLSGKLINADVNGSANIAKKVIGDVIYDQPIEDLMFNPIKINFL
jgi:putative transposase